MRISKFLFHEGVVPRADYVGAIKAPYRADENPSLLIMRSGNSFIDYALDIKGGIVEFIQLYTQNRVTGVKECLEYYEKVTGEEPKKFNNKYTIKDDKKKKKYKDELEQVIPTIQDRELIEYLRERKIISLPHWINEVHIRRGKYINRYIGLKNLSGGFSLRSGKIKRSFGKNDIAVIKGTSGRVIVVEGIFDALSWHQYYKNDTLVILNSTSNIKKFINLAKKSKTEEFIFALDNGFSGDKATIEAKLELEDKVIIDYRRRYKEYDDLNDKLLGKKKTKEEKRLAFINGVYYYRSNSNTPIITFENYSYKKVLKEIL